MAEGSLRSRVAACAAVALAAACSTTRGGGGALDPRFIAVHNALATMGLAQVGAIHEGVLAEGHEARVPLDLAAGCTTVVVLGGDGVRDVDATLLDAQGRPVAHDTTNEPEAVLRACAETADAYFLVLRLASGSGAWLAATWQGGASGSSSPATAVAGVPSSRDADGTCAAPIPLAPGTVTGSTTRGEHENAGSCVQSDSRELVYEFDVTQRQRVTVEVEARFDSVLYLRKDDCTDPGAEVDCNDDAPDRSHSRIEHVLDPGRYFVFVDGYAHDAGTFKMTLTVADVLALAEICRRAPTLGFGAPVAGTTAGMENSAEASCPGGAQGADSPWRVQLTSRVRLRVIEHSDEITPVVHVRRACADEQSELLCSEAAPGGDAVVAGLFDPGGYTVVADAHDPSVSGRYSLHAEVAPPAGTGVPGDACGDAAPLGRAALVSGDTFFARDDVASSCGGAGAADTVYRFDVARRSRFAASFASEEVPHVLVVWHRCGDRSSEAACGRRVEAILEPGTYFLGVDGLSEDTLGRYAFQWSLQDLTVQGGACLAAPLLVDGRTVSGTTAGAGDKFAASCNSSDVAGSGPDRVFKMVLASRARVHLALSAPSFDASLAVRNACTDAAGGARSAEVACASEAADVGQLVTLDRALEAGTYWVVVDGQTPNDQGPFTLEYHVKR